MRKQVCEFCGNIHIQRNRGRSSYKKKKPGFVCSRCGKKNKPSRRGRSNPPPTPEARK